jgi:hypothetical protein
MKYLGISNQTTINAIEAQLSLIETYAVFERVFAAPNNEMLMSYCGWAKLLNEIDCSNANFVCTIPGPMFYIPVGRETQVIWVNQINGPNLDWSFSQDNCYDLTNNDSTCNQMAKSSNASCTLFSPTDFDPNTTKTVRISPTAAPIDPHIHGL